MPERKVTWTWHGDLVQMGDSEYAVHARAHVVGVDETKGAPDLEARFEVRDGVPECVEFTLRARPGGRAVRSADLRLFELDGFTLNAFIRQAVRRDSVEQTRSFGLPVISSAAFGDARELVNTYEWWEANAAIKDAQRRRRSVAEAELEEVARIYKDHVQRPTDADDRGDDRFLGKPTRAVQEAMGYSARTAARRVKQAEEAGLLPAPTNRGKRRGVDQ